MIFSLIETAFVAFMLLIIAAVGTLAGAAIGSILAAFCVFIVASLIGWLIGFVAQTFEGRHGR